MMWRMVVSREVAKPGSARPPCGGLPIAEMDGAWRHC
jgi:hypothetical protein